MSIYLKFYFFTFANLILQKLLQRVPLESVRKFNFMHAQKVQEYIVDWRVELVMLGQSINCGWEFGAQVHDIFPYIHNINNNKINNNSLNEIMKHESPLKNTLSKRSIL